MQRWLLLRRVLVKPSSLSSLLRIRCLSSATNARSPHTEHVQVQCASAGHITLSLHNVLDYPSTSPLIINLPAFPTHNVDDVDSYLPSFLRPFPTATIHYRWMNRPGILDPFLQYAVGAAPHEPSEALSSHTTTPLQWPTPIHDTVFGYEWIIANLSPESKLRRRPVYVYGSYLGASLASSLALTEAHTHEPMAVRGLLAFNGIYNWSRMLPGHPTNNIMQNAAAFGVEDVDSTNQDVTSMKDLVPSLFMQPSDLFDPFVSPVLFFHTAGMLVPPTFDEQPRLTPSPTAPQQDPGGDAEPPDLPYVYSDPEDPPPPTPYEESEADEESTASAGPSPSPPRKGYLAFPPRASSLRIPETLLLHTPSVTPWHKIASSAAGQKRGAVTRLKKLKSAENSFEAHALGLAGLMRKSINRMELRDRMRWDTDIDGWEGEAERRVGVEDVGEVSRNVLGSPERSGLGTKGEAIALRWLEERVG